MSSHREAPAISKDPVADNTDVYAFVDPINPNMVTILANYIPLQAPDAGPNFFEFGDDVVYAINIDNIGDGYPHIRYEFRFTTTIRNPNTFLYNTGPINNITDATWNRPQSYSVTRVDANGSVVVGSGLLCPPCNVGVRSCPNYAALADQAIHTLSSGETVFAGQRREGFYLDLGSIFDLLALRPFQSLHRFPMANQQGVDSTKFVNVHTIALQVPINHVTRNFTNPTSVLESDATIGVWASASRQRARILNDETSNPPSPFEASTESGAQVQVSRLGNPLFNELLVPMSRKDEWNASMPFMDSRFADRVLYPEVQVLLAFLYPTAFPHLAAITGPTAGSPAGGFRPRNDLAAILLTGIPPGIIPGFQNYTGSTQADELRLNVAVKPTPMTSQSFSVYGILGGDLAGFPNGRRVYDDVTTIELRAVAGLTYKLVAPSYQPDAAAGAIYDVNPPNYRDRFHATFPYLGLPHDGYHVPTPEQQAQPAPTPA